MKIKAFFLSLSLLAANSQAASITANTTGDGVTIAAELARAVYGVSGDAVPFGTGYVGVGYFSSTPAFGTDSAASIDSAFNLLGASSTVGFTLGSTNFDGLFSHIASAPIDEGATNADFIGQNIVLVVADGASISASSELLVVQSSATFGADNPTFSADVILQTGAGLTTLFGSDSFDGSSSPLFATFDGATNSYQMASIDTIPEPTAALLGSFGALLLLRRRRAN